MSKRFNLNGEDFKKLGKGALIAGGGAVITYLLEVLPGMDFGVYTAMIAGIAGIALNFLRKFLVEQQ